MSKHNKANKNNYDQAGRLTPDELAREQQKMHQVTGGSRDPAAARTPQRQAHLRVEEPEPPANTGAPSDATPQGDGDPEDPNQEPGQPGQ